MISKDFFGYSIIMMRNVGEGRCCVTIYTYVGNRHQSKRFGGSSLTQGNAMPVAAFILYRTFCLLLSIGKDASKITCICCI